MAVSCLNLIELAYRYYPRPGNAFYNLAPQVYDALYQSTPEYQALFAAQKAALADMARWRGFLAAAANHVPRGSLMDFTRGYHDVCYTARILLGTSEPAPSARDTLRKALVVCVSFLAPLYLVYESHWHEREELYEPAGILMETSAESEPIASVLEQKIADIFGYERLAPASGAVIVPGIQVGDIEPDKASIIDAFFNPTLW